MAVGMRKMASFVKSIHPNTESHYISLTNFRSPLRSLLGTAGICEEIEQPVIRDIAESLAQADIVGISSMTSHAEMTKRVLKEIKAINPKAYTIWGGIHPIIVPEDAIHHADAICTGEGEFAFEEFLAAYKEGKDFYNTRNFWFNDNGTIIKNDFWPLAFEQEMNKFPFPEYGGNELIYKKGQGFVPMTAWDLLKYNGLGYLTIWSIGCPYKCSFCGNTKFIENDPDYRKLRHPSVEYLIRQIKDVKKRLPFISTVVFYDDSFMAIPKATLKEFADRWKQEIGLPFCVMGVIPSFVKEEKMEILVDAGMNRIRMGIQSGSDRILDFYHRPNKPGLIQKTTEIIAKFSDRMIPPAYDIILDNPIETREDVVDTLKMINGIPRPFTINYHSLRVMANTHLHRQFEEIGALPDEKDMACMSHAPNLANILAYLPTIFKPPSWMFNFLLRYAKPFKQKQNHYPLILMFVRFLYFCKRGFHHLRFMDFSLLDGRIGWLFWRLGVIKFWNYKKKSAISPIVSFKSN
jgi:anaerobic magnesium-protoporphyrin IX monomethyl ester cyclase